jgi:hypothetical protein
MFDESDNDRSRLARLVADPVRLRAVGRVGLLAGALGMVVAELLSGFLSGMLVALLWVIVPVLALAIGIKDAFFLQHGRGRRRVILTLIGAVVVALAACVILSGITEESQDGGGQVVSIAGNVLLYVAVIWGLAALISLGIGRGSSYAARRIDEMSREDW